MFCYCLNQSEPWIDLLFMALNNLFAVLEISKILGNNVFIVQDYSDTRKPSNDVELVTTGMYGVVRHPAMSTVMGILLIAPTMVIY